MSTQKVVDSMINGTVSSSKLTGVLPALDGSALTGIAGTTKSSSDPTLTTNPSGGTGTIWLNTVSGEMWCCTDATTDANVWTNVGGGTGDVEPITWQGNTGLIAGGLTAGAASAATANIEKFNHTTTSNASEFGGDLSLRRRYPSGIGDGSRVVFGGGAKEWSEIYTLLDYITVASGAAAQTFGDFTVDVASNTGDMQSVSNGTRGVWSGNWSAGGGTGGNTIQYVTIQTPGDSIDFGADLAYGRYRGGGASDGSRGVFAGGWGGSGGARNEMDFITIATTGTCSDFGDLQHAGRKSNGAVSNSTRGIFIPDQDAAEGHPNINYITIATPGNAQTFGDVQTTRTNKAATSNGTRFTDAGGWMSSAAQKGIYYGTIMTLGDMQSFGELNTQRYGAGGSAGD